MDIVNQLIANLTIGFGAAFSLANLGFVTLGVVVGTFVGVLPGIGSLTAISLLLPLTFHLDATSSLIMLAGIWMLAGNWYGSTFGGSITAVLLNIPGTPANAVTCIDGNALTKQGRGKRRAGYRCDEFIHWRQYRHHSHDAVHGSDRTFCSWLFVR